MKFLIAGLGNDDDEYYNTRHNIGFEIVEALAEDAGASFPQRIERHAYKTDFRLKGKIIYLIKPTTMMNNSGSAVKYWRDTLEIPMDNLLIIVDDVALQFGSLRIKGAGSSGGHNGLKSVEASLGTSNYPRMRFGAGGEFPPGGMIKYVLGGWTKTEQKLLPEKIRRACEAVKCFILEGIEPAMNKFNRSPPNQTPNS